MTRRWIFALAVAAAASVPWSGSQAQDRGSVNPRPLPPLARPDDPATPAKELFGRKPTPADLQARSIGFYSRGCLAGGQALPIDGESWQVMRLSRNRNWGHPDLIALLEDLARRAPAATTWPGILVGDMSQPRGGPMLTGHASHQIGLDADVWLTPMPANRFNRKEREEISAIDVVRADKRDIDPSRWTPSHMALVKMAAQETSVERIFVNAAIKKAICRDARGDRSWLSKVRPMWGHNYHFHIRIACPAGASCREQDPVPRGDGCDASLDWWFSDAVLNPPPPKVPSKPRPPLTMANLPDQCRQVLVAP